MHSKHGKANTKAETNRSKRTAKQNIRKAEKQTSRQAGKQDKNMKDKRNIR